MNVLRPRLFVVLLIISLASVWSLAQVTEGGISGTVTEASGAAVSEVRVTVTNVATGEARQITTDKDGLYHLGYLQPGTYSVAAEHEGFDKVVVQGVQVQTSITSRADLHLKVGSVQTVVEVTGTQPPVNAEEARLVTSLTKKEVQDLPLSGREVYSLVLLQPGVTATLAPVISNTQFNTFNYGFAANGTTPRGNNYVLDGVSNNNEWLGGTPAISPSVEAIETFQVQTANFAPEYGRTNGSIVAVTTRSGTNKFHGSAYDYVRNPIFDAHYHFDQPDAPGSFTKQNNFGASFGGPVVHDRTFFFVNFEGIRGVDSQTLLSPGETADYRQQVATFRPGSIADQQFKAYPSGPCIAGTEVNTGSIYLENLPLAQVQAIPFYQFFDGLPEANHTTACVTAHTDSRPIHGEQFSFRLDHHFTQSDTFFARFLYDNRTSDSAREELNGATSRGFKAPFNGKFPSIMLSYLHLFSPNVLNEAQFMYARSDFGIGFSAPASNSNNYPYLFFDDGTTPFGGEVFVPRQFVFNNYTVRDSVSYNRGRHIWKAGVELQRVQENSNYNSESFGFYEFQDQFTFANDGPYYTEARINPTTGTFVDTPRHFRQTSFSAFVQDDWKVNNRLTANLGLRYDLYGVPTEANGVLSNMTLGSGATQAAQVAAGVVGRVKTLFDGNHANFSPRVGLAFDPTGKGTTAIHASYSLAYLAPFSNLSTNASRFDSPDNVLGIEFPLDDGGTVSYGIPAVPSASFQSGLTPEGGIPGIRISVNGVQRDIKTAYSQEWFLGVQQKLFGSYYLTANYVGNNGKQLYVRNDINRFASDRTTNQVEAARLNSQWAETFFVSNGNSSNYNGINVQLQRQLSQHYSFSVSYTLGKTLDYVSDPGLGDYSNVSLANYNGTMDLNNPRLDYGRSDFDVRHRVAANVLWELPSPHWSTAAKDILGGWQLNSIISLQSGRPFSVWCTNINYCDFNGDGDGNDRPNTPSFGNTKKDLSRSDYQTGIFKMSDFPDPNTGLPFVQPPFGTVVPYGKNGNLGRNTFQGPGFAQVDASIFKTFGLPRDFSLQFRAEVFNLFNRVNLYLPNDVLSGSITDFGQSTAAFGPRTMQLALKITF